MLELWGGGGGLLEYRSALLASRGYAALSLDYTGHVDTDGKPRHLGIDYFEVLLFYFIIYG